MSQFPSDQSGENCQQNVRSQNPDAVKLKKRWKNIIKKFENASDDTLFPIINLFGENYYVPKKSIVYISTGAVEVRE